MISRYNKSKNYHLFEVDLIFQGWQRFPSDGNGLSIIHQHHQYSLNDNGDISQQHQNPLSPQIDALNSEGLH